MGQEVQGYHLWEYFVKGGVCMYPLLLCSIAAVAVAIYKAWQFARLTLTADPLVEQIEGSLRSGNAQGALEAARAYTGPMGGVARALLAKAGSSREMLRETAEVAGTHEMAHLESFLPVLQTVGVIAPLLGFLGTVTGMIRAFMAVSVAGLGDPSVVSSGIAEALITTAYGLMIAIPTFAVYNYLVARVNSFALEMERAGGHLVALLAGGAA